MFVHNVFFWLDGAATDQQRQELLADCSALLGRIPTVRGLWAGRPAMTPREVVDNSYDIGLCVVFDNAVGHDVYQEHALHKQFIAKHKPIWKRVQVYDFT
mgnify:CR=1 FL=1